MVAAGGLWLWELVNNYQMISDELLSEFIQILISKDLLWIDAPTVVSQSCFRGTGCDEYYF